MGWVTGVQFPAGARNVSLHSVQISSAAAAAAIFIGYGLQ
jgi:hypothetical protein